MNKLNYLSEKYSVFNLDPLQSKFLAMNDSLVKYVTIGLFSFGFFGLPISFAQLILGGHYFNECSGNSQIPIFNVVAGVVGLANEILLLVCFVLFYNDKHDKPWVQVLTGIAGFIMVLYVPWYIFGSTLVDLNYTKLCAHTLQAVTNAVVIIFWIPTALFIFAIICVACAKK